MQALAQALAAREPGLTLSAEGLARVEREFPRLHRTHGTRAVGAFLGEVIVTLAAGEVSWVSFETGASRNDTVRSLGEDLETSAILQAGPSSYWFPLVKVGKRAKNGPSDSLVAFKEVVLAQVA